MARTKRVTFKGMGQLNGPIIINKSIDYDENFARKFLGNKRDELIVEALAHHYPGVRFDPRKIRVILERGNIQSKEKKRQRKEGNSIFIKPLWMLPFRLMITALKSITNLLLKN